MKRRNFLKTLSALPVIGLPALAKPDIVMKNGSTITFTKRASSETYLGAGGEPFVWDDPVPDNAVSLAQPRYVGTKTWWEDGKFRSRRITREEFYL